MSNAFHFAQIIFVQGHQCRYATPVVQKRVRQFVLLIWSAGDSATGVAIYLDRQYFPARGIHTLFTSSKDLAGRLGGIRWKGSRVDLTLINVYAVANLTTEARRQKSKRVWSAANAWLNKVQTRSIPVVAGGMNAHVGFAENWAGEAGAQLDLDPTVGPCQPALENANAKQMIPIFRDHELSLVNTYVDTDPTFYSNDGKTTSRISYFATTRQLRPLATKTKVLTTIGDKLQLINCRERREHRPLQTVLPLKLNYTGAPPSISRWDFDKLYCMHATGQGKQEFALKVEEAVTAAMPAICSAGTADSTRQAS